MLDVATLQSELLEHLGVEANDAKFQPDVLLTLLNRSFWEILEKFPFREKEKTSTFLTVAGERLYGLPTDFESVRQLSIEDAAGYHGTLDRWTPFQYENYYINREDYQGRPVAYVREGGCVRLAPTPDDVYTIILKHLISLEDLSADNVEVAIPRVWHEIILYGAVWRGMVRMRDYEHANQAKAHQVNLIQGIDPVPAKEAEDTHYGALQPIRPDDGYYGRDLRDFNYRNQGNYGRRY